MSDRLRTLLALDRGISRAAYLLAGTGLFVVKLLLDEILAAEFGRPFSPLFYVSPMVSPLLRPGGEYGYWLAMWLLALPFIAIGVILTLRRLLDAGLPRWLVVLFFVPFANLLFFMTCALVPSREEPEAEWSYAGRERSFARATWAAGALGAVVGLGAVAVSVVGLGRYGGALLIGSPVILGFVSSLLFRRLHGPSVAGAVLSAMVALLLGGIVVMLFALEGFLCLLMSAPLALAGALFGAVVGVICGRGPRRASGAAAGAACLLLPGWLVVDGLAPPEPPAAVPVTTERIIAAPPDLVWKRVITFPPIEEPPGPWFRAGIAAPESARIHGTGPGAVRECRFTTGSFLEPIEVWDEPRELSFSVTARPDPMREWTLWDGPRPPHLDGYLESTRGQFLLERLPDGRTRLSGRTWYRTNMVPERYWRLWADPILHAIHRRVLDHIAHLAEDDAARANP